MKSIDKLILYGTETKIEANVKLGQKEAVVYNLAGATRDVGNQLGVELKNDANQEKLLEFELEDGTKWMCTASTLHEIYPELDPALPQSKRSNNRGSDVFVLPPAIDAPATERGIVGKITVKILTVFATTAFQEAIGHGVRKVAVKLENKHLLHGIEKNSPLWDTMVDKKGEIENAALFSIDQDFKFDIFQPKPPKNKLYFLFIHGTNSDTLSAFLDLKNSPAWATLHEKYPGRVITFQHRTLTESPLQNTLRLARLLPEDAELHLLTHSRGGIIGDILNLYCNGGKGFNDHHIELLQQEENQTEKNHKKDYRKNDIEAIQDLNDIFKLKKLTITKYIRVACPAAGTKLASKRLDHLLNVFANLLSGVFGDILQELLSAAVNKKDDIDVLPGLEAMNPESPFIKILNDPLEKNAIDGKPLAVISGNGKVNFSGNGLLTLLGMLFYWQRNDLVVNTDSMYLGVRRSGKIQYFFDQGIDVNHVKYFENNRTRQIIHLALENEWEDTIPGFKKVPQYEVPAGDRALIEHGALRPNEYPITGNRPIVIMLPGIMGSNLTIGKREIWLHYRRILKGNLMNLKYPNVDDIIADSVVSTSYRKLSKWLSTKYDVVVYPFDWRIPLEESAKYFDAKVKELLDLDQPIKVVAHSMGGVLVRDFILGHNETWERLNNLKGFQIVFLGAPLSGSHRILTVLFGQDSIIKKLSKLDLFHTKKGLLGMFSKFPGILDLLPIVNPDEDKENNFADKKVWQNMLEAFGQSDWPLPSDEDLARFKIYRNKVLAKREAIKYDNMVYIAGKDKMTPCGYYADTIAPNELYFLYTGEGDQSVTWELGIPKEMLKQDSVYYTRISHGALANSPAIFGAIDEILSKGSTKLLSTSKPMVRGEEKIFRAEPDIDFDLSENGLMTTVLGFDNETQATGSQIPISVTVSKGDLRYAAYPILAGHFLNDGIMYAEMAINKYLEGSLDAKHDLGLYPGEIGTHAIFTQTASEGDFAGAIIVGMGEPDQLTSYQLAKSVEQGVLNYLLGLRGKKASKKGIGISSLIMANGYGGLSIESSMKATILGVDRANEKIKGLTTSDYGTVQHIEFVERYADRALNCMYVLNQIVNRNNGELKIILGNTKIKKLLGIRKRIPLDMSEDWWNRITVRQRKVNKDTEELESMVFGASTSDSRQEENEIYSSTPLINQFISEISIHNEWSSCTAKTLFELLIPNALKEKLKRKGNISWILDTKTASYPWELLQDSTANAKPLCVNSGMIRQLTTGEYRHSIKRVAEQKALVVADPLLEDYIGQLPGAREEGEAVKEQLEAAGYPVEELIGSTASAIMRKLFCEDYSVIHLAGHGIFNPKSPKESGMVIGKKLFLTVFEIQQMPVVPQLVFVNCCHLGYSNDEEEEFYQNRYKLAANIGTELIRIGVKAVIAAGWTVNDAAALEFANVFYRSILSGHSFGDAVKMARNAVYEQYPDTNTWGAYQCYGDPFFKLKNSAKGIWSPSYIVPEEAEIHLDNLLNQLQMGMTDKKEALDELDTIMKAVEKQKDFKTAAILEKEVKIHQELAMYKEAAQKFQYLLCLEKADFSFSCMETYCNTRIKWYVREVYENAISVDTMKEAYQKTEDVINDLKVLLSTGETAERHNLLGSAYKRLSMLAPDKGKRIRAYKAAMAHYEMAYEKSLNNNKVYSLSNAIELGTLLVFTGSVAPEGQFTVDKVPYNIRSFKGAKEALEKHRVTVMDEIESDYMEYWDLIAILNIDLCFLLVSDVDHDESKKSKKESNKKWNKIIENFERVWQKAGSEAKRTAELEHLQFLIHALHRAAENTDSFSPLGTTASKDKLAIYIEELRAALNAIRKKMRAKETDTPKKKRTSSK